MTTCEHESGFTLIEIVVVLAVLGILLGTSLPLAGAVIDAERRQEVQRELADLGAAIDSYYFERSAFPATLTATDFLGVHLQPGVASTATLDAFGGGQAYVYAVDNTTGVATVHSRGENGIDNGVANEEFVVSVYRGVPGTRRTWQRLRLIIERLAEHIEAGGSVAGSWSTVRTAIGLAASYDDDGFGTAFQWTAATHSLVSAGPDRVFGTADDITL